MPWLSLALVILGALAYDLARRVLTLRQPVAPHESLVKRVASLEDKVAAVMRHGGFEEGR
jgi:hypothetical protein